MALSWLAVLVNFKIAIVSPGMKTVEGDVLLTVFGKSCRSCFDQVCISVQAKHFSSLVAYWYTLCVSVNIAFELCCICLLIPFSLALVQAISS